MALTNREAQILAAMLDSAIKAAGNAHGFDTGYKILMEAAMSASKLLKE